MRSTHTLKIGAGMPGESVWLSSTHPKPSHVLRLAGADLTGKGRSGRNRAQNLAGDTPKLGSHLPVVGPQNGRLPGGSGTHPPRRPRNCKKLGHGMVL